MILNDTVISVTKRNIRVALAVCKPRKYLNAAATKLCHIQLKEFSKCKSAAYDQLVVRDLKKHNLFLRKALVVFGWGGGGGGFFVVWVFVVCF